MLFNQRNLMYSNVITFPATKSAGALTLSSDVLSLPSLYKAEVFVSAADVSKVTDTVSVLAKGSFDGGTTWVTLGTYTDLANGTGAVYAKKEIFYAPKIKMEAVFDATGALASGHGLAVSVVLVEDSEQLTKASFYNVTTVGATVGAGATTAGSAISANAEYPFLKKAYFAITLDHTKATLATIAVQGSVDGTNWYTVTNSLSNSNISAASVNFAETTSFVGKYVRVNVVTGASTGALTAGHGTKVSAVVLY